MTTRILIVEDDPRILSFLKRGLEAEGYSVAAATSGPQAVEAARAETFNLIILDRMLPGFDGIRVCSELREAGIASLILMLTARDATEDRVEGLKSGADDYLTKPFAFEELLARIEALLRRGGGRPEPASSSVLQVGELRLDPAAKRAWRGERPLDLTPREFKLLGCFMADPGVVQSRTKLLSQVWNLNFDPGTKIVDVYVRYLRAKVEGDGEKPLIETIRGFGYVLGRGIDPPASG